MTGFRKGDRVRCEREAPAKGTWARYAGKVGTVVVGGRDGEVGVNFGGNRDDPSRVDGWFLPLELARVR